MTQHLNLLVKKSNAAKEAARQILPPVVVALLLPIALWAINLNAEKAARENEAQMQQQLTQTREQLDARLRQAGATTDKEVEALKAQAESARSVLGKLNELGSRQGHSRKLAALASVSEKGLWLTGAEMNKDGNGLLLTGRALEQAAIMRYVDKLNARLSADGVSFKGLDVTPESVASGKAEASGMATVINFKLY